jgi:hypothetical protein
VPCSACIRRRVPDTCRGEESDVRHKPPFQSLEAELKATHERLRQVEDILRQIAPDMLDAMIPQQSHVSVTQQDLRHVVRSVKTSASSSLTSNLRRLSIRNPLVSQDESSSLGLPTILPSQDHVHQFEVTSMLEGYKSALSQYTNINGSFTAHSTYQTPLYDSSREMSEATAVSSGFGYPTEWHSMLDSILSNLPTAQQSFYLADLYYHNVNWLYRVLQSVTNRWMREIYRANTQVELELICSRA